MRAATKASRSPLFGGRRSARVVLFLEAHRFAQQLGGVGDAELFLDPGAVSLHRFQTDPERFRDLRRAPALPEETKDLQLAVAE